jgi:hypothetical protein
MTNNKRAQGGASRETRNTTTNNKREGGWRLIKDHD